MGNTKLVQVMFKIGNGWGNSLDNPLRKQKSIMTGFNVPFWTAAE